MMKSCWIAAFLLVIVSVNGQTRDEWCEGGHDHEEGETPHPEDFVIEIFGLYGDNDTCTIPEHEFARILVDLGIGESDHEPHEEEGHDDHEDHDDHDHRRKKRSVDHTCYDAHDIWEIFNVSNHELGLTQSEFEAMSPALLQQILQGCVEHDHGSDGKLSSGEVWGYSLVAVIIVSACAPLGLVLAKCRHSSAYMYLLTVMLGLAAGTLLADALMHLIPHSIGIHGDDHSHDHGGEIEDYVWKTFLCSVTVLAFFDLQMILNYFVGGHSHSPSENSISPVGKPGSKVEMCEVGDGDNDKTTHVTKEDMERSPESLGYMIAIGDGFHNFADGIALGAAFSDSWQTGLATTIAVFCHELPHEFGDVAAQLSVGWGWKRILIVQLVSQSTAFLGLCIGIPVSENTDAKNWILMMTAGMFLYLALADIVPELLETFRKYSKWSLLAAANCGILIGFVIMLIISILEGVIEY